MNKQAFKQRMQNLKSYRENNPGKGYWDWKVEAFQNGGEVGNPSVQAIQQKQWLNDWLKSRSKQMAENIDFYSNQNVYGSSMDRIHVSPFFFQDKEKNAAKIIQEQLQYANNIPIYDYREPWVAVNKDIPNRKEFLKMNSGVQGAYHKKYGQPNTISISPIATDRSVILHELSHSTQDKYNIQSSKIDDILKRHQKENHNYDKYYDNPDEVYSRMNQFRYDNNIRPEDIITKEQIEQWKDSSIDNEFINRYSTNTLLDLLNSVAQAFEKGGEVGNPDDDFTKAINIKLGRTSDGRPKEQGLKPVIDLEDAANITPIGDALSARDVHNAVTERDWTGAGLAALGVLPFIPSGLRQLKPTARYIPSVSKSREQDLLNVAFDNIKQKREYLSDVANERNRVLESVNDYAHRVRAEKANQMFGTNYSDTYKLLSDLYEHRFFSLPEVQGLDMKEIGKMQAKKQANKKFVETGIGAGPEDFDFLVNPYRPIAADELARHELNHYTDFIISRNRDTSINNNMLKQLESSLRKTNDVKGDYFKLGTEQKAYMNQLRTRMYNDKAIDSLEEPVSTTLIKKYMDSLDDKDSIKRAYKQHKSLSAYTKWFNSIPLLGIGAIGVNKYFNNGTEQEK